MLWALCSAHLVRIPYIHSSEHWPTHSPRSEALLTQIFPLNLIESLLEITYIDFEPAYGHAAVGWAVEEPEWGGDQWIRSLYCVFCFDRREGQGEGEGLGCADMLHCLRDNNFPY